MGIIAKGFSSSILSPCERLGGKDRAAALLKSLQLLRLVTPGKLFFRLLVPTPEEEESHPSVSFENGGLSTIKHDNFKS